MYFSSLHSTVSCIFFTPSLLLMPSDTNVQAAFLNCISFVFVKCISQIHRTALSSPVPPEPNTQWHQCPLSLSLLFLLKHCFVSDLAAQVFTLSQFSATFPLPYFTQKPEYKRNWEKSIIFPRWNVSSWSSKHKGNIFHAFYHWLIDQYSKSLSSPSHLHWLMGKVIWLAALWI